MREFPDPKKYADEHMTAAAERYMDGLRRTGLRPNERLTRAVFVREWQKTQDSYEKEVMGVCDHNIQFIQEENERIQRNVRRIRKAYQERDREIRREGANWGLKIFLVITLVFAIIAWYDFFDHGEPGMWIIYAVGALAFFALSLSAIVNRWR